MKLLQMENGWKDLETDEFWKYGDYILETLNFYRQKFFGENDENYRNNFTNHYGKEMAMNVENEVSLLSTILEHHIYSDNEKEVFDFKIKEYKHTSEEEQINLHNKRVELIQNQGWKDFPENKDIDLLTFYLLQCADTSNEKTFLPYKVTLHFINGKWYQAYNVDNDSIMFLDLIALKQRNYELAYCKVCDNIFIRKRKNEKCCSDKCRELNKKQLEKERMTKPAGLKKKIYNYMFSSNRFSRKEIDDFLNEYDTKSESLSENELNEWLEEKREEFKRNFI